MSFMQECVDVCFTADYSNHFSEKYVDSDLAKKKKKLGMLVFIWTF